MCVYHCLRASPGPHHKGGVPAAEGAGKARTETSDIDLEYLYSSIFCITNVCVPNILIYV